jgi:hypothetical protein
METLVHSWSIQPAVSWIALIAVFTLLAGIGDAYGFVYASRVWQDGRFDWLNALKSALSFQLGAAMLWLALRYLQRMGVVAADVQTLLWFVVTIVIVAAISGRFLQWQRIDQAVGVAVLSGIAWLLVRTGEH